MKVTTKIVTKKNILTALLIIIILALTTLTLTSEKVFSQNAPQNACLCPPAAQKAGKVTYDGCATFTPDPKKSDKQNEQACKQEYCTVLLNPQKTQEPPHYQKFNCDSRTLHSCMCPPPPEGYKIVQECLPAQQYYCEESTCKVRRVNKDTGQFEGDPVPVQCKD